MKIVKIILCCLLTSQIGFAQKQTTPTHPCSRGLLVRALLDWKSGTRMIRISADF
jgi:hypothetical protein